MASENSPFCDTVTSASDKERPAHTIVSLTSQCWYYILYSSLQSHSNTEIPNMLQMQNRQIDGMFMSFELPWWNKQIFHLNPSQLLLLFFYINRPTLITARLNHTYRKWQVIYTNNPWVGRVRIKKLYIISSIADILVWAWCLNNPWKYTYQWDKYLPHRMLEFSSVVCPLSKRREFLIIWLSYLS